jgi:dephospho-CoA kinase
MEYEGIKAKIIGITGIIGSGKTTAASILAQMGWGIIDTDHIAHDLLSNDSKVIATIADWYNNDDLCLPDGGIDRGRLAKLIFVDEARKIQLENLLHPLIYQRVCAMLAASHDCCMAILVPLLFMSDRYNALIHESVLIKCQQEIAVARVMVRGNIDKNTVLAIIAAQMPQHKQLLIADSVIDNSYDYDFLYAQLRHLHLRLCR